MKREVKYRGKRLDNGEWAVGSLLVDDYGNCQIVEFVDHHEQWHEVVPETVGQYTGLKDKNGVVIYEGDILYNTQGVTMHINWFGPQFGCVQHWDGVNGEGSWYPLDNYDTNQWEVFGNIYDNSELLKECKDA